MKSLLVLFLCYLTANALPVNDGNGTNWVVLAAGGGMSLEYSIEADVYHAYQVFRSYGIPEKNIIVMNLDQVAYNKRNPTPGIVISKPNGPDVYHGVPKDYVGGDVTPLNFLALLRGDPVLAREGKKVVKSGPNDNIFVYFMDHGSPNIIYFPNGQRLYGEELNNQLIEMHRDKKYAKLVFYLEACESGSMFSKLLPNDINVYAVTSSSPTENSYATLYDKERQDYLAGYFNYHWLTNAETSDLSTETLDQQFVYIKEHTAPGHKDPETNQTEINKQHAQQYGDLTIAKLAASTFYGTGKPKPAVEPEADNRVITDLVDMRNAGIHLLQKKIESCSDVDEKLKHVTELERVLNGRKSVDNLFEEYVNSIADLVNTDVNSLLNTRQELNNRPCYRNLVDTFDEKCVKLHQNTYSMCKLCVFVNICESLKDSNNADVAVDRLVQYCSNNVKPGHIDNVF